MELCELRRSRCLSIEVSGRAVGNFRIVRYIVSVRYLGVSVKRGSTVDVKARMATSYFCDHTTNYQAIKISDVNLF